MLSGDLKIQVWSSERDNDWKCKFRTPGHRCI